MSNSHLDPDNMTTEELEAAIAAEAEAESSGTAGGEPLTPEGYEDPTPRPAATDPIMGADPDQETETPEPTPEEGEDLFPIKVKGVVKHVTYDKLVELAQQGEDYNVKSAEVNRRKAELDRLQEELDRRAAGGYAPGPATYVDPDEAQRRSREMFEEDPVVAARMVADSSVAPLRAELAEIKASQHPQWAELQPDYQANRRQGMGVDEALTRAELNLLRRLRDEQQKVSATEADKKRARARAATYPTGAPGAAAVPTKKTITRKEVDAMSIKDIEAQIEELGGHIDRELR